jgi:hypothetical protein
MGVYLNMTQAQPQFQRSLHRLVFAEYASNDSWVAVHIGQLVGGIMVFAGGFVALHRLLIQSESNTASN